MHHSVGVLHIDNTNFILVPNTRSLVDDLIHVMLYSGTLEHALV